MANKRTLAPVRPNAGVEAIYRRRLLAAIEKMQRSLLYRVKAQWRSKVPELATDESPAAGMMDAFDKIGGEWLGLFDGMSAELGKFFGRSVLDRSDAAFRAILRKGGFTVRFRMTRAQNDVLQATIGENVGLIRSIASEHLSDVQGIVMRSIAAGRDLHTAAAQIEARYGVTKKRAALIARDQNNKATANMTAARQRELGITEAIWVHSAGGRVPRPSHVKAGRDKMRYDVTKGALIDGEYILPGQLINCRCVSSAVVPGLS